jgi:hypothetical protein
MPPTDRISDKSLAVFAFAAYHQLQSGRTVREVIASDGEGHGADPEAIQELNRVQFEIRSTNLPKPPRGRRSELESMGFKLDAV